MDITDEKTSSNELRIRRVEAAHICDLIRIAEETNLSPWTAQSYLDEIKNTSAIMLRLVKDDNSTIGFVVGRTVASGIVEAGQDAEIYNIAVTCAEQKKGCGQRLFEAFVSECAQEGTANIWLEVRESNQKAMRFYERNGFTRVQTRSHFYNNPREHALLMRLNLSRIGGIT